ncbi:MAG: DNA polymerase III subunit gamma/tau [Acidobacteriota bacterium]|nr:DNA polymerase III subunit gamma/tau [Acidobacteriota bacterium]
MTYQVLARSWRPQRFADLLGQEAAVQTLSNALTSGTFGQAYMFSGLRGVGKTTVARLLAKAVNCTDGPTAEPCGVCESCREIADGSSIDVIEIDGASNRGIDDVRELRELLKFHPTRDRYRVIIIDEVHMLTREAFNALLKSLEEPPPYIVWIFATTERIKVPDTILSRCQQLDFRPVGTDLIRDRLEEIASAESFSLTPSAAAAIAGAAEGSVRDALSLLDQLRAFTADEVDDEAVAKVLGVPPLEVTARLIEILAAGETAAGLAGLREQLASGQDPSILYQEMGRTLRTLVYLALDPALVPTLSEAQLERLQPISEACGADALTRMLGLWLEHDLLVKDASNRELALEVAAMRLARWPSVQQLEAWLAGSGQVPPDGGPGPETGSTPISGGGAGPSAAKTPPSRKATAASPRASKPSPTETEEPDEPENALENENEHEPESQRQNEPAPVGTDDLLTVAKADPGVVLATRILGGDVVAVRPDGEGS